MIKVAIDNFNPRNVTIKMNESLVGKKSIFYFPEDCIGLLFENEIKPISKLEAIFSEVQNQIVFNVLVDDFLWIDKDYKLTDDEKSKAYFGQVAKGKKEDIAYSSIHARVATVYAAICEQKIKVGKINKVED